MADQPIKEQQRWEGIVQYPPEFIKFYQDQGYWIGQTIGSFLQECAEKYSSDIAIICGERQITYAKLNHLVNQFACYLIGQGYQAGESVVLQLPNIAEFFIAYFASIRIGMRPIMSLPAHRHAEIGHFIQQTGAKLYICADKHLGFDYRQLARKCLQKTDDLKQVVVVGDAQEFDTWPDLESAQNRIPIVESKITSRDVAFFQLSGGSTGTPKLIPRTHDDYLYSVRASAEICDLNSNTNMLMVLPVAHNFSLSSPGSLGLFFAGGTLVLAKDASPENCFKLIEKHAITNVALVPALAANWLETVKQGTQNIFAQIKVLQVGGARLADALARELIQDYHCCLQQVFGMAEGLVNYTHYTDDIETIISTQGRPISSDDEVKVVDDEDREVSNGEVGHLLTRGPYTIRGYFNAPEHNLRSFTSDGFYRTGDLVRLTSEGNIIVEGRSKDQINRGGEKIATEEVEQILNQHPQVLQSALVSMPDSVLGEKSCAFIQWRNQDNDPSPIRLHLQLRQFVHEHGLATFKIPDRIELVHDMPYTALGKIDKKVLRQLLIEK